MLFLFNRVKYILCGNDVLMKSGLTCCDDSLCSNCCFLFSSLLPHQLANTVLLFPSSAVKCQCYSLSIVYQCTTRTLLNKYHSLFGINLVKALS